MLGQFKNSDDVELSIRLATASDAITLARHRCAFRSGLDAPCEDEESFLQRCGDWMQERLEDQGRWKCWVAEQDNTIIGNLWMQLIEKIPNPVKEPEFHAYVTNFYVREEARGRGVGARMLGVALEWAKAQDVQAVILWPTEQSRPLYERHGFAVREDLLELLVENQNRREA